MVALKILAWFDTWRVSGELKAVDATLY